MFWVIIYIVGIICSYLLLRKLMKNEPTDDGRELLFEAFIVALSWYGVLLLIMAIIAGGNDDER